MHSFEYLQPGSVAEAIRMLTEYGPEARVLAGGTDLLIQMEGGRHRPEAVIYVARIPELREIDWNPDDGVRIGGAATLRAVENHITVRERYPALARAAKEVGSIQIRNLATLAGNLCNASPSADTSPALLAYEAEVEITGSGGDRQVPVGEFWLGPGRTVLRPGELVTGIRLPPPAPGQRSFYQKLAVRKAMDLAMVVVAIVLTPGEAGSDGDGRVRQARIALGAVAPTCLRAEEAESLIADRGAAAIEEAAQLAAAASSPISDQRASAEYRREMVRVLTRRGLRQLIA
jgi:CO/xanthine dehydrogenase FAD-binding subunit